MLYLYLLLDTTNTPAHPAQWFDPQTLFTAAGSTTAVIAVTSVLQRIFPGLSARWFALALSLALTIIAIGVHHEGWSAMSIFLAIINGLMTYSAAVGVNTVATAPAAGQARVAAGGRSYRWWD